MSTMKYLKEKYHKYWYVFWGAAALVFAGTAYGLHGYAREYIFDTVPMDYDAFKSDHLSEQMGKAIDAIDTDDLTQQRQNFVQEHDVYVAKKGIYDKAVEDHNNGWGGWRKYVPMYTYDLLGKRTAEHPGDEPVLGKDLADLKLNVQDVKKTDFEFNPEHETQYKANKAAEIGEFYDQYFKDETKVSFKDEHAEYVNKVEADNNASNFPLAVAGTAVLGSTVATGYGMNAILKTEPQKSSPPVRKTVRQPRKQKRAKKTQRSQPKVKTNADTTTTKSDATDSKKAWYKNGWTIFFIVLALVAAAAVVYYFFFFQSEEDEEFDAEAQPEL